MDRETVKPASATSGANARNPAARLAVSAFIFR
jgi:hypothetical protein